MLSYDKPEPGCRVATESQLQPLREPAETGSSNSMFEQAFCKQVPSSVRPPFLCIGTFWYCAQHAECLLMVGNSEYLCSPLREPRQCVFGLVNITLPIQVVML